MTNIGPNTVLTIDADALAWDDTGGGTDELVVAHVGRSTVLSLNGAAALLFRRLADGATPGELQSALVEQYGIEPSRAEQDAAVFLGDLEDRSLLRLAN